jgi:TonB family protein
LVIANNFNYSLTKNRIKMMSKIKSSKFAIAKISLGIGVAAMLVVAFACEQKESVEMQPVVDNQSAKFVLQDNQLKIEATPEILEKLQAMFPEGSGFEIVSDSLGNALLKKSSAKPKIITRQDVNVFYIVEEMPEFPGGEDALRQYISEAVNYPDSANKNGIQGKVYVSFIVAKDGSVVDAKIARGVDPLLDKEALRVVSSLPKWEPGKQDGKPVNVSYTVPINFVLK